MGKNVHVTPSEGGWDVREEGAGRSERYGTRHDAINAGRELAKRNRAEHVIHGRDGRIRQSDSYQSDPFPPRKS